MWGQNIRVAIIPSFFAVAYLGQSIYLHSISRSQLSPLATWLAQNGALQFVEGELWDYYWGTTVALTSFALSMAVNTLVTGLIVFKILKVFLEVNAISVERTLGSAWDTKLRQIIFIIIESGVALFAIQLVRVLLFIMLIHWQDVLSANLQISSYFVIGIHQMFNVIIKSVHFYFFCLTDNIYLTRASHQH